MVPACQAYASVDPAAVVTMPDIEARLRSCATVVDIDAHSEIIAQRTDATWCYLVTSGCLRSLHLHEDGRRQIGTFSFPGDLVGWEASEQHDAGVETTTASICHRFARRDLHQLAGSDRSVGHWLLTVAARQLRAEQHHSARIGWMTAVERLASFLVAMVVRARAEIGAQVTLPMSRRDIADYLCLSPETVSRAMSRLGRDGLVNSTKNHFAVRNHTALQRLAGFAAPGYLVRPNPPAASVAPRSWGGAQHLALRRHPRDGRGAVHAPAR